MSDTEDRRPNRRHARRGKLRYRRRRPPAGAAPGTLVLDAEGAPMRLTAIGYGPDGIVEKELSDLEDVKALRAAWPVLWLNANGLGEEEALRALAQALDIHPLVLEDVVNLGQRAKAERYGDQMFVVVRMPEAGLSETEQVGIVFESGVVVTFQERVGDCFEPVRDRIRAGRGRIRSEGADYLVYALIDAVVDHYFPILEGIGETLDGLEQEVFEDPSPATLARIHGLKRELVGGRKAIWPHRDMLNVLMRDAGSLVNEATLPYLRDCYDHVVRIMDLTDAQREVAADTLNIYLSVVSNRMNEVMKVLTFIATIFIPVSFIAGVYGMNFDPSASPWNMPELRWTYGYPAVLALMAVVVGGLMWFMRRKGWL